MKCRQMPSSLFLTLRGKVVMTRESGDMLELDTEGGSVYLSEGHEQCRLLEHLSKNIIYSVASY